MLLRTKGKVRALAPVTPSVRRIFSIPFPGPLKQHEANMHPAVFLDRDGTLIEERHYLSRPEQVSVFPGASEALRLLQDHGFKLFIVSNQSGVGRGFFTLADVARVNQRLLDEFAAAGIRFEKIYIAPEAPEQPSRGRKPSPQFLFDARDEFGIALQESYVIGDKLIDLETGWNAGVRACILVRTGYGAETERGADRRLRQAVIVDNLGAAARWILMSKNDGRAPKSELKSNG